MDGEVRLSVTVVTRNRPNPLASLLADLREQSPGPWEILVSDDSDPEPAHEVRRLAREFECRYLEGPRRGLYANRNHAARHATGTHVRTMDDDHRLPPGHLLRCLQCLAAEPGAVWTVGEYRWGEPHPEATPPRPPSLHPRGYGVTPRGDSDAWGIADGSTCFPRAVFERHGGYCEAFRFGPVFYELGARLRWLGYAIRHVEGTWVEHDDLRRPRSISDPVMETAARYFAMLCLVDVYRPRLAYRHAARLQWLRERLLLPEHRDAMRWAEAAFAVHREFLNSLAVPGCIGSPGG